MLGKVSSWASADDPLRDHARCPWRFRRMLRSRIRTQPSSGGNVFLWLCLKYVNQPRSVGFTSLTMTVKAVAVGPSRLRADRVFQLLEALLPWPTVMPRSKW